MKFEIKKCVVCGKEIEFIFRGKSGDYHRYSKRKYCSPECSNEANKKASRKKTNCKTITRQCIVCNNVFIQKSINHTKCCSPECRKISQSFKWKMKNLHLINNFSSWCKLRFEIFKRDDFTCQYCGRNFKEDKIKIHCDHIIPRSKGGKDVPENLITSCEECNEGKGDVLLSKRILSSL